MVNRRIKKPKMPDTRKQHTLRVIKKEVIRLRFGEYGGQTKEPIRSFGAIGRILRLPATTCCGICR